MISDIISVAHDLASLGAQASGTTGKVFDALYKTQMAKSIAEKAKRSIMMYKVLVSGGLRQVELAEKINKYLENMYACFTLLVLGYNPTTNAGDNSGLNAIISSISAESWKNNLFDIAKSKTQESAFAEASREITFGNEKSEESSKPRIGKGSASRSQEADDFNLGYNVGLHEGKKLGKKELVDGKDGKGLFKAGMQFAIEQNQKADVLFAEKVKKINSYEPTIINMEVAAGQTKVQVPIAVKCNMYPIGTEELRLLIESGISGKTSSFLRKMKWRSGEISTLAWIFGTDLAERDKKLYEKLGRNPWYIELQKRKLASKTSWWMRFLNNLRGKDKDAPAEADKAFEISGYRGDIPPTASLIVTKEDIVAATRLDIKHFTKNEGFVAKFMSDAFLLCLGIVDMDLEQVTFFFMGYKEPFIVSKKELESKGNDETKDLYAAMNELAKKV